MMWEFHSEALPDCRGLYFRVLYNGHSATVEQVLDAMQSDAGFRSQFTSELAAIPYASFRWETPSVRMTTRNATWEFVALDSPGLARNPDRNAFADHFHDEQDVVTFANLGGDATLVVPCPRTTDSAYGHLAAFVRSAPPDQQHALWQAVASAMRKRIGKKPVWLSTAGAGVSWLHIRLDDRPKYYGYAPYAA
jgi:hypothetical protein